MTTIRNAVAHDLPRLCILETACFVHDRLTPRQFRRHLSHPRNRILVASTRATPVAGYVLLLLPAGRPARIHSLAVDPTCRGQGVGATLCTAAEPVAVAARAPCIRLEVRCDNAPAARLYAALGYAPIRRLPGYYADGADGIRMEKLCAKAHRSAAPQP